MSNYLFRSGANPSDEMLATLATFPEAYGLAVAEGLREEYFASHLDRGIFRAIAAAQVNGLTEEGLATAGVTPLGMDAVNRWMAMLNATPVRDAIRPAAQLIRSAWIRRKMAVLAQRWTVAAEKPCSGESLAAEAMSELRALLESSTTGTMAPPNLDAVRARIDAAIRREPIETAIPTGLPGVDRLLGGGFSSGRMYCIAGRPSSGKSMLAIQAAEFASDYGKRAVIVSLEMSQDEITFRRIGLRTQLSVSTIRDYPNENDRLKIEKAIDDIGEAKVLIDDSPRATVDQVEARVRLVGTTNPVDILFVDYVQLLAPRERGRSKHEEIAEISQELKQFSREAKIPVVILAQMNRNIEARGEGSCPKLSDLGDCGSLERDSDVVAFLWLQHEDLDLREHVNLSITKNRHGPCGKVGLLASGATQTFREGHHANCTAPVARGRRE